VGISAWGGLERHFRVLFSAIFQGVALEKRYSGGKHWKAVEAKLLQTAASLRTFFVLVISTQALKSLVALKIAFASLRVAVGSCQFTVRSRGREIARTLSAKLLSDLERGKDNVGPWWPLVPSFS
jgi:hypothetical protein